MKLVCIFVVVAQLNFRIANSVVVQLSKDIQTQIDCNSGDLDPSSKYGGPTCAQRKAANQCGEDFLIFGGFCLQTCGFCDSPQLNLEIQIGIQKLNGTEIIKDEVAELGVTKSAEQLANVNMGPKEVELVVPHMRTLRGCSCPTWKYNGTTYKGCANPNRSFIGGWCPVDPDTCFANPAMRLKDEIEVIMDYGGMGAVSVELGGEREYWIDGCHCCPPELCIVTVGGCSCKTPCTISDFDVGGPWCEIQKGSCKPGYIPSRLLDNSGNTDYCKPGCCPTSL